MHAGDSRAGDSASASQALFASLLPAAVGLLGGSLDLALLAASGADVRDAGLALGNCFLAGIQVSLLPLIWGRRSHTEAVGGVASASTLRRSCPHAASISEPLRFRTFTLTPALRTVSMKPFRSSS